MFGKDSGTFSGAVLTLFEAPAGRDAKISQQEGINHLIHYTYQIYTATIVISSYSHSLGFEVFGFTDSWLGRSSSPTGRQRAGFWRTMSQSGIRCLVFLGVPEILRASMTKNVLCLWRRQAYYWIIVYFYSICLYIFNPWGTREAPVLTPSVSLINKPKHKT